jgi:hypothetical protein
MGMVWGVAGASAIVQNILSSRLPRALSEILNKEKVILFSLLLSLSNFSFAKREYLLI